MALFRAAVLAALVRIASSVLITDIQGTKFQSPMVGQTVKNVTGIVTAIVDEGFYIQGEPSSDVRESYAISVFTESSTILKEVAVGDSISLTGVVAEFRSSADPTYLTVTELDSPSSIVVLSKGNTVAPLVLGSGGTRSPPTQALSSLDTGADGWLSVPNNSSLVESTNPTLQPDLYGMDFWESLEGVLVTVKNPVAIDFENDFGEFWVYGDWNVTGLNSRGGLTITLGPDGVPDANPETVIVGAPIDGTDSPSVSIGKTFEDITGIIVYQFGFYYILPLTAPKVVSTPSTDIPAATIKPSTSECTLTIGDYNIDNMAPNSSTMAGVAGDIANFINMPDIVFVQEIQDNSGPTDDGTVDANVTLTDLVTAIATAAKSTKKYAFLDIDPENDTDGGEPGGNIRQAYLYNSTKISLVPGSPAGGALNATQPILDSDGKVTLSLNPGRIDPTNSAWDDSRKPLAAAWETANGTRFYTVNLHLTAKLDGTSTQGDPRPPINGGVDFRISQIASVAAWVKSLLALDPDANVIVGGDCNEYVQTTAVFAPFDGLLTEIDEASSVADVERYTYVFDQCSEQLDHLFLSSAIVARGTEIEHVHVNNWAASIDDRSSDHDPSVAQVKLC